MNSFIRYQLELPRAVWLLNSFCQKLFLHFIKLLQNKTKFGKEGTLKIILKIKRKGTEFHES